MCGIVGAVATGERAVTETDIVAMAEAVRRRGPDDEGVWIHPSRSAGFGHRRLSIIDTSAAGHQPMSSSCGRYVLTFNGEIYNFEILRQRLSKLGRSFRGHCDAEIYLEAISEWGPDAALDASNGMFAYALWDLHDDTLTLVRDRLGEKPLYYGWAPDAFVFGSQLGALECFPGFTRQIDRDALNAYLHFAYVPAPHSIYSSCAKLPAGATLTLTHDELRQRPAISDLLGRARRYWSPRDAWSTHAATPHEGNDDELIAALDRQLRASVAARMVADVPLGAFLSGGIDSSTIVALMQAQSTRPVKTFSIGYHDASRNEAHEAKRVAEHLGTDHTELYVQPQDVLDLIPKIAEIYDEPFADSSQLPTTIVSQLARRSVKVALSGDGGDEVFGGYNRHLWAPRVWSRLRRWPGPLKSVAAASLTSLSPQGWDGVFRRIGGLLPAALNPRTPGDKVYKLARALDAPSRDALYHALCSYWRDEDGLVADAQPVAVRDLAAGGPKSFAEQMMVADMATYLPDDILVKVDRASMSVGLEARVPLLDHELIEFAFGLPLNCKIRAGKGKWILRKVLHRYVPETLVERPKMGFGVPIHEWLRGPLREWACDLLATDTLKRQGFLRPEPIQERLRQHLSGSHNWQGPLWAVLMFQSWLARDTATTASAANALAGAAV